jgi:hypothetical protein
LLYSEYKESRLEGLKGWLLLLLVDGRGGEPTRLGSGDGVGITEAEDVEEDLAKLSIDDVTAADDVDVVIVRPAEDS